MDDEDGGELQATTVQQVEGRKRLRKYVDSNPSQSQKQFTIQAKTEKLIVREES